MSGNTDAIKPRMTGFFGKIPGHGDFIDRGLSAGFKETWDNWLQHGLASSKAVIGENWLDTYLTSPVWRFVLCTGVCGSDPWAGIIIPSVDRVGRYFPLTIATSLPSDIVPFRGDTTPYVGFELTPITMDPTITQFSLSINGHSIRYAHGPIVAESFDWPGPLGVGEIRMEMSPGNGMPMRLERGPWSLFRVLDEAKMRPGNQPEHFEVDFELGGRTATYQLVARSAYNPFKFEELSKFRCPETLTR